MKIRIATLFLTILCLALTASAGTFYNDGGIDGNVSGLYISGPNFAPFQDISNGFVSAASGTPNTLEWGEWSVGAPTTFSYEIGTSAFGTDLGSGAVTQNSSNSVLLFTNRFGYGIYDVTIPVISGAMTAGNTYWVSLSNATDAGHDGTQAWDIPNSGTGGPAQCNFRQGGTNYGSCNGGASPLGESFTLTGSAGGGTTPEPSSILLFGSGILGLAGVLRRKLNR